uniref:Glyco_hydro_38N domain-containing protein n=1 Tax=Globodera pallida TaxID=36090 RepID=A0A183C7S7_GLOPA
MGSNDSKHGIPGLKKVDAELSKVNELSSDNNKVECGFVLSASLSELAKRWDDRAQMMKNIVQLEKQQKIAVFLDCALIVFYWVIAIFQAMFIFCFNSVLGLLALVCSFSSLLLIYALKERNPSLFVACLIMEGIRLIPIVLVWFWFLVCAIAPSQRFVDVRNEMTGLHSTIESLRAPCIANSISWAFYIALVCWVSYFIIFREYKAALHGGRLLIDEDEDNCPKWSTKPGAINVHLIAHTHDDLGWLKTADDYYTGANAAIVPVGVQFILNTVIEELERDPSRRFSFAETGFLHRWLIDHGKAQHNALHRLITETDGHQEAV